MKSRVLSLAKTLATAALVSAPLAVSAVTVPACVPGVSCLQFGDFNVFSLPLLNAMAGAGFVPKPGDPYHVSSTYGAIKDYTILGINNGQSTTTGNPPAAMDGAFDTPSPNNTTNVTFSTATAADPSGGPLIGDKRSWDASIPDLLALSGGTPLTAFFAFNETGKGTGLLNTDLLIWARATVYNYDDQGGVLGSESFYLSGDGTHVVPDVNNLPAPDATDFGAWVYVHAGICVDASNNFMGFPDTAGTCPAGQVVANQNNLGQNAAAFMLDSPGLDFALTSGKYDVLSIDWQMAYINGGGETAWIQMATGTPPLPEPGTLLLAGLSLATLAIFRRNQSRLLSATQPAVARSSVAPGQDSQPRKG